MKKVIVFAMAVAALATVNLYKANSNDLALSNLQMENIEALGDDNPEISKPQYEFVHYDSESCCCGCAGVGNLRCIKEDSNC